MFFYFLVIFNSILIGIMGIFEIKNFKKFLTWAIIIAIFSVFGYLAYIIFGNALKFGAKKQLLQKQKSTKNYLKQVFIYPKISNNINPTAKHIKSKYKSEIWHNNKIKIFTNGNSFLDDLLNKIQKAKYNIHIEFFIFSNDSTGTKVANALIKKAKQGVNIKIIYDSFGSRSCHASFWQNLINNNIEVEAFFPPLTKLAYLNFKINYRNHRKIVIIDGKLAYTGGINLRDDHMGKTKKLSPWRDTQLKIEGYAVYALQDIFLNDWAFCRKNKYSCSQLNKYFPKFKCNGEYAVQVVDSGPEHDIKRILHVYIKLIQSAKRFVYIQTPYFLIDETMLDTIIKTHKRGVDIAIFLPLKPDKKIVYGASILNISKLFESGIKVYLYNGFIHSKVLLTDSAVSIGSCNFDYRSFCLNFECTCLCYDKKFIDKNLKIIKNDINNSILLDKKRYLKLKSHNFLVIWFYKLIAKIL